MTIIESGCLCMKCTIRRVAFGAGERSQEELVAGLKALAEVFGIAVGSSNGQLAIDAITIFTEYQNSIRQQRIDAGDLAGMDMAGHG